MMEMIDKKKFISFNRITIAVIAIFILLSITRVAMARFESNGDGVAVGEIAFYIINPMTETQSLKMFDVKPDGNDYIFNIDVSNFSEDGTVSEVDLEYQLELITTTNIPVEYKIYLNNSETNDFNNKEIFQDEDGMYFFRFQTPAQNFQRNIEKTDHYQLVVTFPSSYNEETYQDLIDSVEVVINAQQGNYSDCEKNKV